MFAACPPGARVALDLACGSGAKMPWLAEAAAPGALILGLDSDRTALRAVSLGPRLAADAHALPLRDSSLDLIWCVAALALFARPHAALREAQRVLKPGGALVLAMATEQWVRLRPLAPAPASEWASRPPADGLGDDLRAMIGAAGLRPTVLRAYLLDPPGLDLWSAAAPLIGAASDDNASEPEPRSLLFVATAETHDI
jgi:SAM-dependent methyltransferase